MIEILADSRRDERIKPWRRRATVGASKAMEETALSTIPLFLKGGKQTP
jgi:hypothetical protein